MLTQEQILEIKALILSPRSVIRQLSDDNPALAKREASFSLLTLQQSIAETIKNSNDSVESFLNGISSERDVYESEEVIRELDPCIQQNTVILKAIKDKVDSNVTEVAKLSKMLEIEERTA